MRSKSSQKTPPGSVESVPSAYEQELAAEQLLLDQVKTILSSLSKSERQVLQLRFGLLDGRPRAHLEIETELGLTEDDVRSIEASALRKLRDSDLDKIRRLAR